MRCKSAHSNKQHTKVICRVARLKGEVAAEELMHLFTILCKLGVDRLVVLENMSLVKKRKELTEVKIAHLFSYEGSFECGFLDKLPDLEVGMA